MQLSLLLTVVYRGAPGEDPFCQLATSCTRRMTDDLLPIENVPENWKLLLLPKWPLPTWVYVVPPSVDAQTRTSGFVRAEVETLFPFHASAVKVTVP